MIAGNGELRGVCRKHAGSTPKRVPLGSFYVCLDEVYPIDTKLLNNVVDRYRLPEVAGFADLADQTISGEAHHSALAPDRGLDHHDFPFGNLLLKRLPEAFRIENVGFERKYQPRAGKQRHASKRSEVRAQVDDHISRMNHYWRPVINTAERLDNYGRNSVSFLRGAVKLPKRRFIRDQPAVIHALYRCGEVGRVPILEALSKNVWQPVPRQGG